MRGVLQVKIYMLTYDVMHEGHSTEGLFFFKSHAIARLLELVKEKNYSNSNWIIEQDQMSASDEYRDVSLNIGEWEVL